MLFLNTKMGVGQMEKFKIGEHNTRLVTKTSFSIENGVKICYWLEHVIYVGDILVSRYYPPINKLGGYEVASEFLPEYIQIGYTGTNKSYINNFEYVKSGFVYKVLNNNERCLNTFESDELDKIFLKDGEKHLTGNCMIPEVPFDDYNEYNFEEAKSLVNQYIDTLQEFLERLKSYKKD